MRCIIAVVVVITVTTAFCATIATVDTAAIVGFKAIVTMIVGDDDDDGGVGDGCGITVGSNKKIVIQPVMNNFFIVI